MFLVNLLLYYFLYHGTTSEEIIEGFASKDVDINVYGPINRCTLAWVFNYRKSWRRNISRLLRPGHPEQQLPYADWYIL